MGLSFKNDDESKHLLSHWKFMLTSPFGSARDAFYAHWTWTPTSDFTLGGHDRGNLRTPLTNREMTYCAEYNFGTQGLIVGGKWDTLMNNMKMTNNVFTAYFNY